MNKKQIFKEMEELEATGQDSEEKGAKAVIKIQKEFEENQKKQDARTWELLHSKRRTVANYKDALLNHMKLLKDNFNDEVPPGYQWWIMPTEKGILLTVRTKEGKWVGKGTMVSGEPKYDINAVERLLFKGLEYIDSLEQIEERNKIYT